MSPKLPSRVSYQRNASGIYKRRITNPLDPRRRIWVKAPTRFALEEIVERVRLLEHDRRLGRLAPTAFARAVRALLGDEAEGIPTVAALWAAHLQRAAPRRHRSLRAIWSKMLAPAFGPLLAVDVTPARLDAWQAAMLAAGYAPSTVRTAFGQLAACVRYVVGTSLEALPWLKPQGGGAWRPVSKRREAEGSARPAIGSLEELARLIDAALAIDAERRASAIYSARGVLVTLVVLLSLRNGEAAGLGWDDFTRDALGRLVVHVRHQAYAGWQREHPEWTRPLLPCKAGSGGRLVVHPDAARALEAHRAYLESLGWYRPDGPVFPVRGGAWCPNNLALHPRVMRVIATRAGLPHAAEWVTHSLRHSGSTLEHVGGADLRTVAKRTRHADLTVLEGYIHAATGRDAAESAIGSLAGVRFDVDVRPRLRGIRDASGALALIEGNHLTNEELGAVTDAIEEGASEAELVDAIADCEPTPLASPVRMLLALARDGLEAEPDDTIETAPLAGEEGREP